MYCLCLNSVLTPPYTVSTPTVLTPPCGVSTLPLTQGFRLNVNPGSLLSPVCTARPRGGVVPHTDCLCGALCTGKGGALLVPFRACPFRVRPCPFPVFLVLFWLVTRAMPFRLALCSSLPFGALMLLMVSAAYHAACHGFRLSSTGSVFQVTQSQRRN